MPPKTLELLPPETLELMSTERLELLPPETIELYFSQQRLHFFLKKMFMLFLALNDKSIVPEKAVILT